MFDQINPNFATFPQKTPNGSQEKRKKEKPIRQNRGIALVITWESGNIQKLYTGNDSYVPTKEKFTPTKRKKRDESSYDFHRIMMTQWHKLNKTTGKANY